MAWRNLQNVAGSWSLRSLYERPDRFSGLCFVRKPHTERVSYYAWQFKTDEKYNKMPGTNEPDRTEPDQRYTPQAEPVSDRKFLRDSARAIRLANENGYLSWCRNAYLSTAVGVMMTSGTTGNINLAAQYAASGAFMVGFMNLVGGTLSYSGHLVSQRQIVKMSLPVTVLYLSFAVFHLCLWTVVLVLYMGYVDDDISIIEMEQNDIDKKS